MKAIVIGGGIGGSAAVRSFLKHGIDVEAYERASAFTEIGAGLQLAAPTVRILNGFGLTDELEQLGVSSEATTLYDLRSDRMISSTPLGESGIRRYGEPFYQVHRPDLLNMLTTGLPEERLHLGMNATSFEQTDGGVRVEFESGDVAEGDVLIGADGIHSLVRDQLLGEANPEFSNIIAWRALIPEQKARHIGLSQNCHVWIGPNRSAVVYYVHGSKLINFVGMVPESEITEESWTTRGDVSQLRRSFHGATMRLWNLIELIDDAFITGYYFRYPLSAWSVGRVTILGDAAHPMHPFLAQGACQAIEDGAVLAPLLARHGSSGVSDALKEYETIRYPRATKVQNQSRTHERLWHMSEPREMRERNAIQATTMEIDPFGETVYGWLYQYDAEKEAEAPTQAASNPMQRPESRRAWEMWANLLKPTDLGRQHHGIRDAYDRFQLENFLPAPDVVIEDCQLGGVSCVRSRASQDTDSHPIILHFHGGGYLLGSARATAGLTSRIAQAVHGEVYTVDYRLAPEHPFPAALEDAIAAYRGLLEQGVPADRIVITGESSGAGLATAVAMQLNTLEIEQPDKLVLMSPMADMTVSGLSIDDTAGTDPVGLSLGPTTRILATQMAANYMQGHDPKDPLASPVYGPLYGLPPMLIQSASNEAFFSDAQRLEEIAIRHGVDAKLSVYEDTVHVFSMFDFLPESDQAIDEIRQFITQN